MAQDNCCGSGYAGLVLLAALAAIEIAQRLPPDQLELLSNFFEALGENLALLTSPKPTCCNSKEGTEP